MSASSSGLMNRFIRSDVIQRIGLDYESVRKIRPGIIYVHGTGFAEGGTVPLTA